MTLNISLVKGSTALPIHEQIVNSVRHAISSGRLKAGERLPPVRKLALDLDVAMNTVARAYRDLYREGLTDNGAGRGTFVKQLVVPHPHHASTDATAIEILRPSITALMAMGLSRAEIGTLVEKLLSEAPLYLGVIGSSQRGAEKWARALELELRDFRIESIPITLSELATDPESVIRRLDGVTFVFTLLTGYHLAREILEATGRHVVPLITQLSHQCQQELLALPRDVRVGLVCEDIYLNSIIEVIASFAPTAHVDRIDLNDVAGARRLASESDVLVYTFAAGEIVEHIPADRARLLPLIYTLSEENIAHVRRLIAPHAPPQRQRSAPSSLVAREVA